MKVSRVQLTFQPLTLRCPSSIVRSRKNKRPRVPSLHTNIVMRRPASLCTARNGLYATAQRPVRRAWLREAYKEMRVYAPHAVVYPNLVQSQVNHFQYLL